MKSMRSCGKALFCLFAYTCVLPASGAESASSSGATATIKSITRTVLADTVRVTIELDSEVPQFHEERLADPPRVFVDLPSTRAAAQLADRTLRFDRDQDVVRLVRIGRHPNNTTRVVLDAAGVSTYSVYLLYHPHRVVIDCARVLDAHDARRSPIDSRPLTADSRLATTDSRLFPPRPLPSHALATDPRLRLPSRHARATLLLASARESESADAIASPLSVVEALDRVEQPPPARPLLMPSGGYSIARQLGLNVSRIVIDPGHGGHDPGAQGKDVAEAELVLDVALRLEALLRKIPGVEVILTRRTDEFIALPERTAIANREGADLFLSIHANASPHPSARGIETYFLNFANNLSAAAVAARENAASAQAMGALPDFVKAIALNNKVDESREFAGEVQHALFARLRGPNRNLRDLGVKQAPFVVLIGAAMPSALAEISFVTNPQEAKLLRSSAYRQRIAEALLQGIKKYQSSLKHVTSIAHQ
jgi:N-acetylmuramoyl-L-alanine amidase